MNIPTITDHTTSLTISIERQLEAIIDCIDGPQLATPDSEASAKSGLSHLMELNVARLERISLLATRLAETLTPQGDMRARQGI